MQNKLILINGSPRKKGTSFSFCRTLAQLAEDYGYDAEILHGIDFFDGRESMEQLMAKLESAEVIGLSLPLYVDTLPYPAIWLLEQLEERANLKGKGFFALSQCGFPDYTLLEPSLTTCRLFAETAGMNWLGGLGYGGGAILDGAKLEDLGKKGKTITEAFRLTIKAVMEGQEIPPQVQEMIKVKIPKILKRPLALFMNHRIKSIARSHGIKDKELLLRRVYLEE